MVLGTTGCSVCLINEGLPGEWPQSIMGATLKRREGSGPWDSGFKAGFAGDAFNVFCTGFRGVRRF